jgi:catechol 2,3-dioxygenase-like lactoylglutathione lyase family enzyme
LQCHCNHKPSIQSSPEKVVTMAADDVPSLDGVHHVKLPVTDLERTRSWYADRLGYVTAIEFTKAGRTTGITMSHPDGGPMIGFVHNADLAARAAGFDYFSIGVRDKETLERLAARLSERGEQHAGVHFATIGWILPGTHDPDGHEVRFYTTDHHAALPADGPLVIDDPVGTEAAREAAYRSGQSGQSGAEEPAG